jgi:hypothetical protein
MEHVHNGTPTTGVAAITFALAIEEDNIGVLLLELFVLIRATLQRVSTTLLLAINATTSPPRPEARGEGGTTFPSKDKLPASSSASRGTLSTLWPHAVPSHEVGAT